MAVPLRSRRPRVSNKCSRIWLVLMYLRVSVGMMFAGLAQEIDDLKIPIDGDALAEALELHGRMAAKIVDTVGAFDVAQLWDIDAATSMVAWLRDRGRLGRRDAARVAHTARHLRDLPAAADAFADGRLSGGQVDALLACPNDKLRPIFAAQQDQLLGTLAA